MAKEEGQVQPVVRISAAGFDGGPILFFRCARIFLFLGNTSRQVVGFRWRESRQGLRLLSRLVQPSTHDSRGVDIELGQIGAGIYTVGSKFDGAFELSPELSRQAGRRKWVHMIGFVAVGSPEPKMVFTIIWGETHSFLAVRHRMV